MEELLAYACLLGEGYPLWEAYEARLNALFLAGPENEDLLELELLSGDRKKTLLWLRAWAERRPLDKDKFGRALMELLRPLFHSMGLYAFLDQMYCLWEALPEDLQMEEPFFTLSCADSPLCWEDEAQNRAQLRELCEEMLSFYAR